MEYHIPEQLNKGFLKEGESLPELGQEKDTFFIEKERKVPVGRGKRLADILNCPFIQVHYQDLQEAEHAMKVLVRVISDIVN